MNDKLLYIILYFLIELTLVPFLVGNEACSLYIMSKIRFERISFHCFGSHLLPQ